MLSNDLVQLTACLCPVELKGFKKHLKRRFNSESPQVRLFSFIRKQTEGRSHEKLTYERAFKAIASGTVFKKITVLNTISDVKIELREFLAHQEIDRDPFLKKYFLLRAYQRKPLKKVFEKQLKATRKELDQSHQKDLWNCLKHMLVDHENYFSAHINRFESRQFIFDAINNLIVFFKAAMLKLSCEAYNGYKIRNEDEPNIPFLSQIEQFKFEATRVYHKIYQVCLHLIKEKSLKNYQNLKTQLFETHSSLSKRDSFVILTYLLNFNPYKSKLKKESKDYYTLECFEMMQFGIKHQIFEIDGSFDAAHFINIIEVGAQLRKYNWVDKFITTTSIKLHIATKDYYITLGKALLYFKKQQYEKAHQLLIEIDRQEPAGQFRGRWLKIISHYEIDDSSSIDSIISQCDSLERYIKKSKDISLQRKKSVKLSLKVLRLLLKVEPNVEKIKRLIENENEYYYRSWLLEKLEKGSARKRLHRSD